MTGAQLAYSVAPSTGHDLAGHYECAKRIPAILEALQQNKLTADSQPQKVGSMPPSHLQPQELPHMHTPRAAALQTVHNHIQMACLLSASVLTQTVTCR